MDTLKQFKEVEAKVLPLVASLQQNITSKNTSALKQTAELASQAAALLQQYSIEMEKETKSNNPVITNSRAVVIEKFQKIAAQANAALAT